MNTIKNNGFYNVKIIDKNIYITTTINGGSINLIGDSVVNIEVGSSYIDAGATVGDGVTLTVTNNVNSAQIG